MARPLNDKEQIFAEMNIDVLDKYLSRRHLDYSTYYDVVVFGYLRAVIRYLSEPELQKYKFSTIANSAMNTEVSNYHRALNRKKRKAVVLNIDAALFAGGLPISEIVPDVKSIDFEKQLSDREKLDFILSYATDTEKCVLKLSSDGFTHSEIGSILSISESKVGRQIYNFRRRVLPLITGKF